MPRFIYKAKKGPKEIVEGEIDAENEEAAISKISELGLIPVKIISASEAGKKASAEAPQPARGQIHKEVPAASIAPSSKSRVRIKYRDFNIFTRQFAILQKANVPLLKIFDTLQGQTEDTKFKAVLQEIQSQLRQGSSLSEVLAQYPAIFSNLFMSMVEAGEVSGTLDVVLTRLAEFVEKEAEIRSRVQAAVIYPFFLLLMGAATVFVLLTFIMPRMMTVFNDLGTELPPITQWVMNASRFCQSYWILILGVTGVLGFLFRTRGLSPAQKKSLDAVMIRMPVFGKLIEKSEIAKFLRSLELLYENGISLYRAVEVAAKTVTNDVVRTALAKIPSKLEGGITLAQSLEGMPFVSTFVINMVSVGEESGQLGSAVRETASFYEQETNQMIKIATSLLEPFMILIVGSIVGFMVIAMLLPIFEIHVLAQ